MAKQSQTSETRKGLRSTDLTDGFRSFQSAGAGMYEIKENEAVEGVFQSRKEQEILDKETQQKKLIWVYRIKTKEGTVTIGGRTMLDRMFEDAIDDMFGGHDADMRGAEVRIVRGADKIDGKKRIGQFDLFIKPKAI